MKTVDDLTQKSKEELLEFIAAQQYKIDEQQSKIQTLQHQLGVALNARFGRKSEQQSTEEPCSRICLMRHMCPMIK